MSLTAQMAKHLRDVHFGGNWTAVNLRDTLADVNWEEATRKVESFNTIAVLVYHIGYFVSAVLPVFRGEPLTAKDKYSFSHQPIASEQDWQTMLNKSWEEAELLAQCIEQLPEERLSDDFWEAKYGSWFRNIQGIIEHTHYHLGQIVIIKKLIQAEAKK